MYSTNDKGKTCKRRACFLSIICFFRNYTIVLDELKNFCNTTAACLRLVWWYRLSRQKWANFEMELSSMREFVTDDQSDTQ